MSHEGAKSFLKLANWIRAGILPHLSPIARDTLLALVAFTNREGLAWPSAEKIAEITGHKRQSIYPALGEIERAGIFRKLERIRYKGVNVLGPHFYRLSEFDPAVVKQFITNHPPWTMRRKGDSSRFRSCRSDVPNTGTTEAVPDGPERGTAYISSDGPGTGTPSIPPDGPLCGGIHVPDGPLSGPPDGPQCGVPDGPVSGTQKGFKGKEKGRLRAFGKGECERENLLPPQEGGTPSPPVTPPVCSLSLNPEKPQSTAREKQRAEIVQFFRAELSTGNGVKPLEAYLKWFPPRYGREDIEWAYLEASGFQAGAT